MPPNNLNGTAVLDRVRSALAEAHAAGQPCPGRPTLARITGATEHQIRKALATLQHEHTNAGETEAPQQIAPLPSDQPPAVEFAATPQVSANAGEPFANNAPTPSRRRPPSWPLVIIGLAAAISVWSGWSASASSPASA